MCTVFIYTQPNNGTPTKYLSSTKGLHIAMMQDKKCAWTVLTFSPSWPRICQRACIQIYESFWLCDWRRLMLWMVGWTCGGKRKRRWAPSLKIPTDTPTKSICKLEPEWGCGWKMLLLIGFFWALHGTETDGILLIATLWFTAFHLRSCSCLDIVLIRNARTLTLENVWNLLA